MDLPRFEDVEAAAQRIAPYVHRTPVLRSSLLDRLSGARLFFKCENFQKVGAFKARGAVNAVFSLDKETAARGVATHSSGNHAAALAYAAAQRGIPAHIAMPENAPAVKQAAVEAYGGRIRLCAPNLPAREAVLAEILAETGAEFVPPYDDARVIAGQGTCALELLAETGPLDAVIAPIGGGGLMSGTALSLAALAPQAELYAAEPAAADDAYRSFKSGAIQDQPPPQTIADGLKTTLGARPFAILKDRVSEVLLAEETEIVEAMRLVWTRMKILIEPSSAVPVAAILKNKPLFEGRRVGVILSGGNVDLDAAPWMTAR